MTQTGKSNKQIKPRVLLAEDDASMRAVIRFNLEEEGYQVTEVSRGDEAVALLQSEASCQPTARPPFELVITDVKMPGQDGMEVLRAARECHPGIAVVLVTAFGTVEHAIAAMSQGAADYITKPFRRAEFKMRISRLMELAQVQQENQSLRAEIAKVQSGALVTSSPRMQDILKVVERVAVSDIIVLISGESGTGKELLAKAIHSQSTRSRGPFVAVNCAALPRELLESELFGHERGAFTGADRLHPGKFEQADGGTLFLDEIGELPLELQAKILRVFEENAVNRVGGQQPLPVNVRVVVATNRDLESEVAAGRFRKDLFHRLSVVPLKLPPLRERPKDVPLLVQHFLQELGVADKVSLAPALMEELLRRPWPGNVRELRNLIARMVLLRNRDVLDLADLALPGEMSSSRSEAPSVAATPQHESDSLPSGIGSFQAGHLELPTIPFSLPDLEKEIVEKALAKHKGNQSATARFLGIPRHVLLYKLEKYKR